MGMGNGNVVLAVIITMIVTIIACLGMGYYLYGYLNEGFERDLLLQEEELRQEFGLEEKVQEDDQDVEKDDEQDEEYDEVFAIFNADKVKGIDEKTLISLKSETTEDGFFEAKLDNDGVPNIYITEDGKKEMEKVIDTVMVKSNIHYGIGGFNEKTVLDVFIGNYKDIKYPIVLFLMEDQTVEYLNAKNAFETFSLKSSGKIDALSDVVKIEQVEIKEEGKDKTLGIVAVHKDGTSTILNCTSLNK